MQSDKEGWRHQGTRKITVVDLDVVMGETRGSKVIRMEIIGADMVDREMVRSPPLPGILEAGAEGLLKTGGQGVEARTGE